MAYEDIIRAPAAQSYGPLDLGIYPHLGPLVQNLAANLRAARQQQQDDEQAELAAEAKKVAEARRQSEADRAEEKFGLEYGQEVDVPQAGPVRPGEAMPTVTKRTQGLRQMEAESKGTSREEAARIADERLKLAQERFEFERSQTKTKKDAVDAEKADRELRQQYNTAFNQNVGLMSRSGEFKWDPNNPMMKMAQKRAWDQTAGADKSGRLRKLKSFDREMLQEFLQSSESSGVPAQYAMYLLETMGR